MTLPLASALQLLPDDKKIDHKGFTSNNLTRMNIRLFGIISSRLHLLVRIKGALTLRLVVTFTAEEQRVGAESRTEDNESFTLCFTNGSPTRKGMDRGFRPLEGNPVHFINFDLHSELDS